MTFHNPTYYEMYGRGVEFGKYQAIQHILDELRERKDVPKKTIDILEGFLEFYETSKKDIIILTRKQTDLIVQIAERYDIDISDFYIYESQNPIFRGVHQDDRADGINRTEFKQEVFKRVYLQVITGNTYKPVDKIDWKVKNKTEFHTHKLIGDTYLECRWFDMKAQHINDMMFPLTKDECKKLYNYAVKLRIDTNDLPTKMIEELKMGLLID